MADKALDRFMARHAEVEGYLEQITEVVKDHFGVHPDAVTWGDVTPVAEMAEELREMRDRLLGQGEYA